MAGLGGLRLEPPDKGALLGDLLLPLRDFGLHAGPLGFLEVYEGVVVARVEDHALVVHVDDVGGHIVQEAVVMGDHHHAALESLQEALQPARGQDVQVVGGLIEQQGVGLRREGLGQQHSQLEPAAKGG